MSTVTPAPVMSIAEASRRIQQGDLRPSELLARVVERIEATEPQAHAFVRTDLDEAFAAAAVADRTPARGPLHGIPFGVKDVFDVRGRRTTCGMPRGSAAPAARDADVVGALREAGAILLGMQVTHELTCGVDEPPTRNPAHPHHYAGGSSVGSGTSVAIGSSFFSLGTDAAGSVRIPASATGTVGLKPTRGLLSRAGIVRAAHAPTIDNVGILARSVEDVGLVLSTLVPAMSMIDSRPGLPGTRIGVLTWPAAAQALDVAATLESGIAQLVGLGGTVVRVRLAELTRATAIVGTIFAAELAAGNRRQYDADPCAFHPKVAAVIRSGQDVTRRDLIEAHLVRRRIAAAVETLFQEHRLDVLVTPTMPVAPPLLADLDPGVHLSLLTALTCPFNLSGHPAISVPGLPGSGGLPIGVQLVGRRGDETHLLRVAAQLSSSASHQ